MDGGAIVGFAGIGLLVLGNIAVVAYTSGRLWQKVEDLCGRVTRLEESSNSKCEKEKGV